MTEHEEVTIASLEMANVKRVKAVRIVPTKHGLTILGGRNGAGKTSVLDIIQFALGGKKYMPSNYKREGAVGDSFVRIELSNGLVVERKGKNADLHVTDTHGKRHGQAILDSLISDFSINLPKFHNASAKEKATILLQTLGLEEQITALEREEKAKYDSRVVIGRQAEQKKKAAEDMEWFENAPPEPVSVAELIDQNKAILARNGERQRARNDLARNKDLLEHQRHELQRLEREMSALRDEMAETERLIETAKEIAPDEDTSEVERQIAEFEETNRRVSVNAERVRKMEEAETLKSEYAALTSEIQAIRDRKFALLKNAHFPLPGLSVENGELCYNGQKWDCMSGAQQLIVDCAIAAKIKPECRLVLLDKLEQLDPETLEEFANWTKRQGLQCWATRVSTGGECTLIIEDGEGEYIAPDAEPPAAPEPLSDDDI